MTEASASTCAPWATEADVCAPCDTYEFDPVLLETGLQIASDVLFNLTGRRWPGICTDLVRPAGVCGCDGHMGPWLPPGIAGGGCPCGGVSEVVLPGYPVVSIIEVLIDGVAVDPARYRVDNRRRLVWQPEITATGGRSGWPCCPRLDVAADEDGTWSVEYEYGQDPPAAGIQYAGVLGCQLALACSPATIGQCRLPKRVTSITRQGVSLAVLDPLTLFLDGLTGLSEVDLWVQSIRLGDARRRATAWVPGRPGRARRDTT